MSRERDASYLDILTHKLFLNQVVGDTIKSVTQGEGRFNR